MSASVDVREYLRKRTTGETVVSTFGESIAVYEAVVELIEADKEYDAAKDALAEAGRSVPSMSYPQWADRYDAAEERFEFADNRRRAALARVQGGAA